MDVLGFPIERSAAVFAVALLAAALVQWLLRRKVNWLRAFALSFGVVSGSIGASYFGLDGVAEFIAIAAWVTLLVAGFEQVPKLRLGQMPNSSLKRTDQSLRD